MAPAGAILDGKTDNRSGREAARAGHSYPRSGSDGWTEVSLGKGTRGEARYRRAGDQPRQRRQQRLGAARSGRHHAVSHLARAVILAAVHAVHGRHGTGLHGIDRHGAVGVHDPGVVARSRHRAGLREAEHGHAQLPSKAQGENGAKQAMAEQTFQGHPFKDASIAKSLAPESRGGHGRRSGQIQVGIGFQLFLVEPPQRLAFRQGQAAVAHGALAVPPDPLPQRSMP